MLWILFALGASACFAVTAYLDEYLTRNNTEIGAQSIHTRIGGIIVTSVISNVLGAVVLFSLFDVSIVETDLLLQSLLTAVPMLIVLVSYLYLLDAYTVSVAIPLFQLTSLWLLLFSYIRGEPLTMLGVFGVISITLGAYAIDRIGSNRKIPSKLLVIMLILTGLWAGTLHWMEILSVATHSMPAVIFWQDVCATVLGICGYVCISQHRLGFLQRVQSQRTSFLSLSALNEALSQLGYCCKYASIGLAPVIAYANAIGGIDSILLIVLLWLFPIQKQQLTIKHFAAICVVTIGALCIELASGSLG